MKLKIENVWKELKAAILGKNEFEDRVESRLSDCKNFWQFQIPVFNAGSWLIVF